MDRRRAGAELNAVSSTVTYNLGFFQMKFFVRRHYDAVTAFTNITERVMNTVILPFNILHLREQSHEIAVVSDFNSGLSADGLIIEGLWQLQLD